MLNISDNIHRALDEGEACLLILIDLSAAFDTINHPALLETLKGRSGINGIVLKWFASYLQHRSQQIRINSCLSKPTRVTLGVPQGTILSPALFNLFMEPLTIILRQAGVKYHLYADDTQLYFKIKSHSDILHLNVTLNKIQSWFKANHLKLNPNKTELILFASKSNHLPIQDWLKNLDALNCSLALSDSVKSLGITLDKYLSMRDHIKNSTKSALYALKQLKKMKPFIPQDDLKTIVQSLVLSKLDYGNAILTGTPKTHLAPLRSVLNMAARLITGAKRYDHITPVLRSLNWLPMEGRCIYKLACITHKTLHSQSPNYLNNKLVKAGTARSLRSSNSLLLIPPKLKKKTTQARSFSGSVPRIWNSLPADLRCNPSLPCFKRDLKFLLLKKYFIAQDDES